ncbi:SDR family oxidoreductase [Nocardia sp. alder85J]|uniref:SDR family oxidoreductase n=1 Tax=Nocardia sp. alder85J TaxID=2862949 RepID=UPI001CD2C0E7|nr:NAD(P)H-binding protein [Nocardia sp. alder85J]MCX4090909.1 NAD(P)H-binding protein [Nocardia sp. alder85J]
MTIAVTGATGTVGRLVVRRLLAAGRRVRAVTRNPAAEFPPDVEVVIADLDRPESLTPALTGADALFLMSHPPTATAVARQAQRCGTGRIVTLSSIRADTEPPDAAGHRAVERAVESVGVPWTHLRPGMFATNLLTWAPAIRATGIVREPCAAAAQTPIHEADIADVAAAALLDAGHAGRKYPLTGPRALTKTQQLAAIATALGRDLTFQEITPAEWHREQADTVPPFVRDFLLEIWSESTATPESVSDTVAAVTGCPARPLTEWAADHAPDFGGTSR